ncbi:2,3-bisphosphoglycerate-independent phosphoglycerate mutase [hydrothermal vent metagenome]|uniref:phosphoglycerate mutase (2,3-diphosphoglycerate-independent) n=1 Tax=hydrothermal vent metagenome TaxID=652676 RepID=A0A3B1E5Z2_9ZZZZ
MLNKTVLIITDGIGHNDTCKHNAFCQAKKPTYDYLFKNVPNSLIKTYGLSVGLPNNQMGNSEVGHMTIGSGRILYQDLVKINISIENNTLQNNKILQNTLNKSHNIHLLGLISDGGVHSHINHIIALAKICEQQNKQVFIHIITDGRDVAPDSAKHYVQKIIDICGSNIHIATISGRYYTMDRDARWNRVQKGYEQIVYGKTNYSKDILEYIDNQYSKNIFDEFIEPISFNNYNGLDENDGVIFCNFRSDRFREISNAISNKDFKAFKTKKINLNITTMTQYDKNLPLPIMFPKNIPKNTLADVISQAKLSQVHIAETEKYAHVTFFLNGGVEDKLKGEKRVLVPSPNIDTYDIQPEMSASKVSIEVLKAMDDNEDFIVVNFANGDMVGHTGNLAAAITAVECVDTQLGLILKKAKEQHYNLIITSDHGNCEKMQDENGKTLTNHTIGDVYCFAIIPNLTQIKNGGLNNIAPTVLKAMNLNIPNEMDEALF